MLTVVQSLVRTLTSTHSRAFAVSVAWPAPVPGAEVYMHGIDMLLAAVRAQVTENCTQVVHGKPQACLISRKLSAPWGCTPCWQAWFLFLTSRVPPHWTHGLGTQMMQYYIWPASDMSGFVRYDATTVAPYPVSDTFGLQRCIPSRVPI